jgi:hypothetical protein
VVLQGLGHGSAGATLPKVDAKVAVCLAVAHGDKPFLRAFLVSTPVDALVAMNSALYHLAATDAKPAVSGASTAISWRHSLVSEPTPQLSLVEDRPARCLQFVSLVDAAAVVLLSSPATADEFRSDAALLRSLRDEHVRIHAGAAIPLVSVLFASAASKLPQLSISDLASIRETLSSEYLNVLPRLWA